MPPARLFVVLSLLNAVVGLKQGKFEEFEEEFEDGAQVKSEDLLHAVKSEAKGGPCDKSCKECNADGYCNDPYMNTPQEKSSLKQDSYGKEEGGTVHARNGSSGKKCNYHSDCPAKSFCDDVGLNGDCVEVKECCCFHYWQDSEKNKYPHDEVYCKVRAHGRLGWPFYWHNEKSTAGTQGICCYPKTNRFMCVPHVSLTNMMGGFADDNGGDSNSNGAKCDGTTKDVGLMDPTMTYDSMMANLQHDIGMKSAQIIGKVVGAKGLNNFKNEAEARKKGVDYKTYLKKQSAAMHGKVKKGWEYVS